MRVTANTYTSSLIEQLNRLGTRQNALQIQAATGQRVRQPEDDPLAARLLLETQFESRAVAQYQKNIDAEEQRADASFTSLKALKRVSDRAGEIATLADGLRSPEELSNYANEVTELIKQAVQFANSKHNGTYLFSGTRTDQAPFSMTTDSQGRVEGVTYSGNQSQASVEIAENLTVTSRLVGTNPSGSGPRGLIEDGSSGADFFKHLISLQHHLLTGDTAAIADSDLANLQKDEDNLLFHISQNGLMQGRLEASRSQLKDRAAGFEQQVSDLAGADLAQTMVDLSATTTAYQAALQSSATILNLSLMNYLR